MKKWYLWAGIIVAIILVALGAFNLGRNAHVDAEATILLASQNAKADEAYQDTIRKINENKTQLARLDEYETKISALAKSITNKRRESSELDVEIRNKRQELASLNRHITIAASTPIVIPAGHHPVGSYVRAGRYSATGSSNFVVYGADGDLKIKTILGDNGVDCYVCDLEDGDTIETESSTTLTPLEE